MEEIFSLPVKPDMRTRSCLHFFTFGCVLLLAGSARAEHGLRRQAWLGASLSPPRADRAGAEVIGVRPDSSAARAGLKAGDLVIAINSLLLSDELMFEDARAALRGGDTVRFAVKRGATLVDLQIPLAPMPLETVPGLELQYGSVVSERGHEVRTIVSRPERATSALPAIFVVGWLSCDSVEAPLGPADGFATLLRRLETTSGMVVIRMDKPGVGDSDGPRCSELDFWTELAAYRATFRAMREHRWVDPNRIVLLGMSNGGGVAPLVAERTPVAGYIVSGGWSKTWLEHMLFTERLRLTVNGAPPADVSDAMRSYAEFYAMYLQQKRTPGEVVRDRPHLARLWTGPPGHQYGRPAAFYQQLQELNLEGLWSQVQVPVLAVHGEHDLLMSRSDHERIVDLVNANRPGLGRFVSIPRMDHGYYIHPTIQQSARDDSTGSFHEPLVALMVGWMKEAVAGCR